MTQSHSLIPTSVELYDLVPVAFPPYPCEGDATRSCWDLARHLDSSRDRAAYWAVLDRAIDRLRDAGCAEVDVLAHSLGSVLVYDWLKSAPQSSGGAIAVLHTIGSPLNKFWYIDHRDAQRMADREGLQGRVQQAWINDWTPSDLVSGALRWYEASGLPVRNVRVRTLGPWVVNHTAYWTKLRGPGLRARATVGKG